MLRSQLLYKGIQSYHLGYCRRARHVRFSSSKALEPLRILFCGSDDFSITSLQALYNEARQESDFIKSIDVVCRPGKRTGRGLKTLREVPIKRAAEQLQLPVHEIDTFTGWKPPIVSNHEFNLVIAVSFGLLIPPRILQAAKFGGLNVHPSLLPDLWGPAPIQHALIQDREQWGVTIQTLHPKHFDRGRILAQVATKASIPDCDFNEGSAGALSRALEGRLAAVGASALIKVLRAGLYLGPPDNQSDGHVGANRTPISDLPDAGREGGKVLHHARKTTPEDRRIDWQTWTWRDLCLRQGALGHLWDETTYSACSPNDATKRVIFQELEEVEMPDLSPTDTKKLEAWRSTITPGRPILFASVGDGKYLPAEMRLSKATSEDRDVKTKPQRIVCMSTRDNPPKILHLKRCTVESGAHGRGQVELLKLLSQKTGRIPSAGGQVDYSGGD